MIDLSTRPNCPFCKKQTLVGLLQKTSNGYSIKCPNCFTIVYLTKDYYITHSQRNFWLDGTIIK